MGTVSKSIPAQRDLDEITFRIARDSVDAALRWYDRIDQYFGRIAQALGMGTRLEGLAKGLRSVAFGNYMVFFRPETDGIEIVRVIHGKRNWERILRSELQR
jgi:toxin ParE1/3/4